MARYNFSKDLDLHFRVSSKSRKLCLTMAVVTLLQSICALVLFGIIFSYRDEFEDTLGDLLRTPGLIIFGLLAGSTASLSTMFSYRYFTFNYREKDK